MANEPSAHASALWTPADDAWALAPPTFGAWTSAAGEWAPGGSDEVEPVLEKVRDLAPPAAAPAPPSPQRKPVGVAPVDVDSQWVTLDNARLPFSREQQRKQMQSALRVLGEIAALPKLANGRPARYQQRERKRIGGAVRCELGVAIDPCRSVIPQDNKFAVMADADKTIEVCQAAVGTHWANTTFVPSFIVSSVRGVAARRCAADLTNMIPPVLLSDGVVSDTIRAIARTTKFDRDDCVEQAVAAIRENVSRLWDSTIVEKSDEIIHLNGVNVTLRVCLRAVKKHWSYVAYVPDELIQFVITWPEFRAAMFMLSADLIDMIPRVLLADVAERLGLL
jgi:hypothetical protein